MSKKILLVDDSSTSRMASRMLFADQPYELSSACDGKEAVEKAIAEQPDLILMDIEMPRMSGLEACRILKQNEATKRIPVVLLTMRSEDRFIQQGYACGCSDFLVKPVNGEELRAVLKAHLGE